MRALVLILIGAALASATPRVDNVLEKMVPPGANSLAGFHLDQLRQTEMYRRLPPGIVEDLNRFPREAGGFDPRRDLREALYAGTPSGGVLLARGTFPVKQLQWKDARRRRHGQYDVWVDGRSAFCILDATLAMAGDAPVVEAALDEWTSGAHAAAQPLLAKASLVEPQSQVWGVSADLAASFAGKILPDRNANGFDFSSILKTLGECWFEADLSSGIHLEIHGVASTEKDAANLVTTVRGVVGLGRLNVPEGEPELLRVWDGITADQKGRAVTLRADIARNLADKLMDSFGRSWDNSVPDAGRQNRRAL